MVINKYKKLTSIMDNLLTSRSPKGLILSSMMILWAVSSFGQISFWKKGSAQFRSILDEVRQSKIDPELAHQAFAAQWKMWQMLEPPHAKDSLTFFPLWNKNYTAVGGKGRGYRPKGFNLFDHAVSGSHPAQDIFIWDRNKDGKEDRTQDYWPIVALRYGVVVDVQTEWDTLSQERGGKYIWVYDSFSGGLWYYAHLHEIHVIPGQWIEAGHEIATLGRTGKNAWAKRSDTHLHLMYLELDSLSRVIPKDPYPILQKAKTQQERVRARLDRAHFITISSMTLPMKLPHIPTQSPVQPTIEPLKRIQLKEPKKRNESRFLSN